MGGGEEEGSGMKKITAKYQIALPHEVLAVEEIKDLALLQMGSQMEIAVKPPELRDESRLQMGRFGSLLRLELTLDIDKKPVGQLLDLYFLDKCTRFLATFILRLWITTETDRIDPFQAPIFIKWSYFDSAGNEYVNPETGKSTSEAHFPCWVGLTRKTWEEVIDSIVNPTYIDEAKVWLLHAKRALKTNHPDQAIICAAIACEVSIKRLADKLAKEGETQEELWRYLTDKVRPRVMTYLQNVIPTLGGDNLPKSNKKLFRAVERLFEYRNKLVHHGYQRGVKGMLKYAPKGIQVSEEVLNWVASHA